MLNVPSQPKWQIALRQNFTQWETLADFLELTAEQRKSILVKSRFPLNLPLRIAQKIPKGTLDDPLLRQFLPTVAEGVPTPHFVTDPVGDQGCKKSSKLLHKYAGRVLLVCTSACAMHCRYCFRQNFDYDVQSKSFDQEIQLIAQDPSIKEVILSGGDPLSLPDRMLKELLDAISSISHVKRIRFHTRFIMGIPERIDESFLSILKDVSCQLYFVIHANHPREFDADIWESLKRLQQVGAIVLNQAVLLRGVNDDVEVFKELCEQLADHGVLPYYLHQLDRVQGAGHFEVSEEEGYRLIEEVAKQLSGYAVPRYVREVAGEPGKTIIH